MKVVSKSEENVQHLPVGSFFFGFIGSILGGPYSRSALGLGHLSPPHICLFSFALHLEIFGAGGGGGFFCNFFGLTNFSFFPATKTASHTNQTILTFPRFGIGSSCTSYLLQGRQSGTSSSHLFSQGPFSPFPLFRKQ